MKRLLLLLLAMAASMTFARWVFTSANPEIRFWSECMKRKKAECAEIRGIDSTKPLVLFTGGSSCAFSIDPALAVEGTGFQGYNLGGPVAMGAPYLIRNALCQAHSGDVVVLALERHFLVEEQAPGVSHIGLAVAFAGDEMDAAAGAPVYDARVTVRDRFVKLRPGGRYLASFLGKKVLRKPDYRYVLDDFRGGGRLETAYRDGPLRPEGRLAPGSLGASGKELLTVAVAYAKSKGVRLCYSLPWMLTTPEAADHNRALNAALLSEVAGILPVIEDPAIGVVTEASLFSDSFYHLTAEGAALRSKAVSGGLASFLNP